MKNVRITKKLASSFGLLLLAGPLVNCDLFRQRQGLYKAVVQLTSRK